MRVAGGPEAEARLRPPAPPAPEAEPRMAREDGGGAKLAHRRPAGANAKQWEKLVVRRLPNRTIFYRLDQRARRAVKAGREPK